MAIKPYQLHLKKIDSGHQALLEGLLDFSPNPNDPDSLQANLRKILHKHLGQPVAYYLSDVTTTTLQEFYNDLPEPCVVATLSLTPLKEKAFVQIDPWLAGCVVDKLLGGEGQESTEMRALTESEQGVLEFLLLELLAKLHQEAGLAARCQFRLDALANHAKEIQRQMAQNHSVCQLVINVTAWQRTGFIKIFLPHPLVAQGLLQNQPELENNSKKFQQRVKAFQTMRVELFGELGEVMVTSQDLQTLAEGDVVLFDQSGLKRSSGGIRGEVILRIGRGETGGVTAQWDGFGKGGCCVVHELLLDQGVSYGKEKR